MAARGLGIVCASVAVSVAAAGSAATVRAAPRLTVVVRLDNAAGVAPAILVRAQAQVERIFASAGVGILWRSESASAPQPAPGSPARSPEVAVQILDSWRSSGGPSGACVLGVAMRTLGKAEVFYDRVLGVWRQAPVDLPVVLGRVLAHEIGHLLLPFGSHSGYGIMRADLDLGTRMPIAFTGAQAQAMRAALDLGLASASRTRR